MVQAGTAASQARVTPYRATLRLTAPRSARQGLIRASALKGAVSGGYARTPRVCLGHLPQ